MTQRIGGIFSVLSRRDFNIIKQAEIALDSDESFEGDTYESIGNYSEGTDLEEYSVPDLIEVVELYISYFDAIGHGGEIRESDYWRTAPQIERIRLAEEKGGNRHWSAKLQPILKKLRRVKDKMENQALG